MHDSDYAQRKQHNILTNTLHQYFRVHMEILWDTVQNKLPVLQQTGITILEQEDE